jgi:hypothetical protein
MAGLAIFFVHTVLRATCSHQSLATGALNPQSMKKARKMTRHSALGLRENGVAIT